MRSFTKLCVAFITIFVSSSVSLANQIPYNSYPVFANSTPAFASVTGLETNRFTWGTPAYFGGSASSFYFIPNNNDNFVKWMQYLKMVFVNNKEHIKDIDLLNITTT